MRALLVVLPQLAIDCQRSRKCPAGRPCQKTMPVQHTTRLLRRRPLMCPWTLCPESLGFVQYLAHQLGQLHILGLSSTWDLASPTRNAQTFVRDSLQRRILGGSYAFVSRCSSLINMDIGHTPRKVCPSHKAHKSQEQAPSPPSLGDRH